MRNYLGAYVRFMQEFARGNKREPPNRDFEMLEKLSQAEKDSLNQGIMPDSIRDNADQDKSSKRYRAAADGFLAWLSKEKPMLDKLATVGLKEVLKEIQRLGEGGCGRLIDT